MDDGRRPEATERGSGARDAIATFALLAALLFGGAAIGLAIGLGPGGGSPGAVFVGFMTLPLVLGLTLTAWRAAVLAWLFAGLGRAAWRSRGRRESFEGELRRSLGDRVGSGEMPGTWVFLPVAAGLGALAAVLSWLWASGDPTLAALAILGTAVVYGLGLRRLARRGLLPLPED